jgi:hypothetical protein
MKRGQMNTPILPLILMFWGILAALPADADTSEPTIVVTGGTAAPPQGIDPTLE